MSHRLFLTGATGFLGQHLLARLRRRELEITCLVRKSARSGETDLRWVVGDLRRPEPWIAELEGVQTVVHVAAVTGTAPPSEHEAVNAEATSVLARRAAAAGARFVFVSTVAVKFADRSRYPYARAKLAGEAAVRASGTPWVIVRPTIVLGEGAPVLEGLRRLARLPVLPLFGGGTARVQPVHVADLAELLDAIVQDDGLKTEVVEAGGPEVLRLADLLLAIRRLGGRPPRALRVPLGPLATFLWWLERAGLRLPVTAGQLATFVEDGVAEPHPWIATRQLLRTPLAEMLR